MRLCKINCNAVHNSKNEAQRDSTLQTFEFYIAFSINSNISKGMFPDLKLSVESDANHAEISTLKENALNRYFVSKLLIFESKMKDFGL